MWELQQKLKLFSTMFMTKLERKWSINKSEKLLLKSLELCGTLYNPGPSGKYMIRVKLDNSIKNLMIVDVDNK